MSVVPELERSGQEESLLYVMISYLKNVSVGEMILGGLQP